MKLKTRLTLSSILLAVIPLISACLVIGVQSYQSGKEALYQEVKSNLVSRRNIKKGEVESYIHKIENQVKTQARSTMFIDGAREFIGAFDRYLAEVKRDPAAEDQLALYYKNEFSTVYQQRNEDRTLNVDNLLSQVVGTGRALQANYIGANPHPLGSKDTLDFFDDGSSYATAHQAYHPGIRYFLKTFGFYDIFLVDPHNGNVVYSVYKELDYATSLDTGPYRDSGLAEAYREAKNLGLKRAAVFTQFKPYTPSFESSAAFVSTPIIENGKVSAILIFQMPVDEIDALMTFSGNWVAMGMGETGETYLLDSKGYTLNNSRFFVESPAEFIDLLDQSGFAAQVGRKIKSKNTTIGQLQVNSEGSRAALRGEKGFAEFEDYRGVLVASAYATIEAGGLGWAILSEIDAAEAYVAIAELRSTIITSVVVFAVLALIVSIIASWWLSRGAITPMIAVSESVQRVVSSNDLSIKIPELGDEEVRGLATSVNTLVVSLRGNFGTVSKVVDTLKNSATVMMDMTQQISVDIDRQDNECTQVATAASQLQSTAAEVARNAAQTADETRNAIKTAEETQATVGESTEAAISLAKELASGKEILTRVAGDSDSIGTVLDVINGIAEQTNLLALNAAIEAARAGEQGRGFAVVADEVRGLAQRTQTATTEIEQMISSLQSSSVDAVKAMDRGSEMANVSVQNSTKVSESLDQLCLSISRISDMNLQVATAAEEQTSVVDEISRNVTGISDAASENADRAEKLAKSSSAVNSQADELHSIVDIYTV